MMKKIFLLLISLNLFAANIINYNIYKRDDRLDVMLSFDSPYRVKDGNIRILSGKGYSGVVLEGVKINEKNSLVLNMPYADQLIMYPHDDSTVLEFKTKETINIIPAVTKDDGFGLRIRVIPKRAKEASTIQYAPEPEIFDFTYFAMIAVLFVLLGILIYIKKQINTKASKLSSMNLKNQSPIKTPKTKLTQNNFKTNIICEKQLDKDNKFIVLEHENTKYKLIIGNTNIWLDTPTKDDENFEDYFEENKLKLQNMIKQNNLNLYKEKISRI